MSYPNYSPQDVPHYQQQGMSAQGIPSQSAYQLTRDEKRVLKECAQESFYRKCVPLMTALGLGAYYSVHLGYVKGHVTYGAAPKVAAGMLVGFIAGKLSYRSKCEEKILRLPGGKLKESVLMARNAKDRLWNSTFDDGRLYKDATIAYALPPYTSVPFSSNELSTASELDTERHHDMFDDSFKIRSPTEGDNEDLQQLAPPARSTSYDELRSQNRDEYEVRRKQYSGPFAPSAPSNDRFNRSDAFQSSTGSRSDTFQAPTGGYDQYNQTSDRRFSTEQAVPSQPRQWKNFYGDIIEK